MAHYLITVDGVEHETDGKTCLIDNAGNMGMQGVTASKSISVRDGLLDVFVIRDASVGSLIAVDAKVVGREKPGVVKHWQGLEIKIECDPPQTVQGDGENWDPTPVSDKVLPVLTAPDKQET